MYLLYCDESNLEEKNGHFFVYAGIAVHTDEALNLVNRIESLRERHLLDPEFKLKFNPRPKNITHEQFKQLKSDILNEASNANCKFLSTAILHNIATSPEDARHKCINRILLHFNAFLSRESTHGLVVIDRFNDKCLDNHLHDLMTNGLEGLPYSDRMKLDNIIGIHLSAIMQSQLCSLADIVIGSYRYIIDEFNNNDRHGAVSSILTMMKPMLIKDSPNQISPLSIHLAPQQVQVMAYRDKYTEFLSFLENHGIHVIRPPYSNY